MPPLIGSIKIKREGEKNITINHGCGGGVAAIVAAAATTTATAMVTAMAMAMAKAAELKIGQAKICNLSFT